MCARKLCALMMMLLIALTGFPALESQESEAITVEVMIDFGDGTVEWAQVVLTSNRTAIKATEEGCVQAGLEIDVGWSGWGAFINSIEGLSSPDWSWYWEFLIWNKTTGIWESTNVGASDLILKEGDIIGWRPDRNYFTASHPTPTPAMKYPWSMFQYDALNLAEGKKQGPENNSVSWIFNTGTKELACSPVMARGKIIINNYGGVFCLNEEGELLWKRSDLQAIYTPAIHGNMTLIGGKDGYLYALNSSNGETLWKTQITAYPGVSGVASPPAVVRGRIFVGGFNFSGGDGDIYCIDQENGAIIWKHTAYSSVYFSSPGVKDGMVYVGTMGSYNSSSLKWGAPYAMLCFDANSGTLLWNVSVDDSVGSSPTIVEKKLLFTSKDGHLYCLSTSNGDLIWKRNIGNSISSPAVSGDLIYVGSGEMNRQGIFHCIDLNGNILWEFEPNGAAQSSPAVAGGHVYFATNVGNGTIYCLDKDNGRLVWQYTPWPEQYIISSPAIADGKMLIASDNGRLYCFGGMTPYLGFVSDHTTGALNVGEDARFVHRYREYIMRINSMNTTAVSLTIDSLEGTFDIHLDEVKIIDTDGDGEKDLAILLDGINLTSQEVSITLYRYTEPEEIGLNMVVVSILALFIIGLVIMVVIILIARHISKKTGATESGKEKKENGS